MEELRNKVEWSGDLSLETKDKIDNEEEEKYTGKLSFDITGWIFPNAKGCRDNIILDIGTDKIIDNNLAERIYDETMMDRPLFAHYIKETGESYNNPREFANGHPYITNAFIVVKKDRQNIFFFLDKERLDSEEKIFDLKKSRILIEGYNFTENTQVMVISNNRRLTTPLHKDEFD